MSQRPSKASKRPLARDPGTGRFELASPQNDPALLDQCVRWVRAIDELRPLLSGFAQNAEIDPVVQRASFLALTCLESIKASTVDALSVDKELLREAKKPVLRAARRSGVDQDVADVDHVRPQLEQGASHG